MVSSAAFRVRLCWRCCLVFVSLKLWWLKQLQQTLDVLTEGRNGNKSRVVENTSFRVCERATGTTVVPAETASMRSVIGLTTPLYKNTSSLTSRILDKMQEQVTSVCLSCHACDIPLQAKHGGTLTSVSCKHLLIQVF